MTARAPTAEPRGRTAGAASATIARLPGWQVLGSRLDGGRLAVSVATDTRPNDCTTCHAPQREIVRMGVVSRRLAEAPLAGRPTVLIISRRRFRCIRCEATMAQPLPMALDTHRVTLRCRDHIIAQGGLLPAAQIARQIGIHADTVGSLLADAGVVAGRGRPRSHGVDLRHCGFCLRAFASPGEVNLHHPGVVGIGIPRPQPLCPTCHRQHALEWMASNDGAPDDRLKPSRAGS